MGLAEELRNVYKYDIIRKENSNEKICFQKNIRNNFNGRTDAYLYGICLGSNARRIGGLEVMMHRSTNAYFSLYGIPTACFVK